MENYFDNLKEQVKYAKNKQALKEIKRIANRKLLNILENPDIKASVKSSTKRQFRVLIKKIKAKLKKVD